MTTAIQEYSATDAALSELASKYKGVLFDCSTADGMNTAIKGRAEIRNYRVVLEKMRKEIKEPALRRSQLIDSEARRITAELEALENPIDAQIKREQERKELERAWVEGEGKEKADSEALAIQQAADAKRAAELAEIERGRAELAKKEVESRAKIEREELAARFVR